MPATNTESESNKPDYSTFPSYNKDIYSEEGIFNPHPHYRAIREAGPVVYLTETDVLAVGRFNEVRSVLMDNKRFVSSKGVSLNKPNNDVAAGTTLMSDPPRHKQLRSILTRPITPTALQDLKEQMQEQADGLIDRLVEKVCFNGVTDFAQYLPLTVVAILVGLPEQARDNMLDLAAAAFNGMGPFNKRAVKAFEVSKGIFNFLNSIEPDNVLAGSWADELFKSAERGEIDEYTVKAMILDYTAPALDTTIAGTSQFLYQLGKHPEQWELVKKDPSLIPKVFEESLRIESPIRGFSRVAAEDVEFSGVTIKKDSRVLVLYASANSDETQWENPETFNIVRPNLKKHMGFGFGIHQCAGQHLARLEMTALLNAMVKRVNNIEVSDPQYLENNTLRVLSSMNAKFS